MANKNFIVKNGLEVGGQEVVSSSGVVTSAALGGQTLASTDSPTFNNLTLTNDIAVGGDLNLTGDLNITGDVNSLSVTDLDVTDQTITLGAGQVESASGGSGIVVDGSGASILWDETNNEWDLNKSINVTGGITSSGITYMNRTGDGNFINFNSDGSEVGSIETQGNEIVLMSVDRGLRIRKSTSNSIIPVGTARTNLDDTMSLGSSGARFTTLYLSDNIFNWGKAGSVTVFNQDGTTADFRVESTSEQHMLFVDGGLNRIGMANSAPNAKLHIDSTAATGDATNPALQIGGTTTYRLGMYTSTEGGIIDNANGDDGLQFHTKNAGEAVRITADGNLQMIGQTTSFANPGFTYHTNNYLYCRGGSAGLILSDDSGSNTVQIIDGASGYINFETSNGTGRMRIMSHGGVAIGTNNTGYSGQILSVKSGTGDYVLYGESSDANCGISLRDNSSTLNIIYGAEGNNHVFKKDSTEYMRIDSSGTIFQGTTTPTLHSATRGIVFENGALLNDVTRGAGKSITLAQNAAVDSGNTYAYLATDEASAYQQFNGNHYFYTAPSGSAGTDITFDTKLFIGNTGNVGIGTSSPSSTLTVNGTIESLKDDSYGSNEGGQITLRSPANTTTSKRYSFDTFNVSAASVLRLISEDDSDGANGVVRMALDTKGTFFFTNATSSFAHNTYAHAAVFSRNSTPQGTVVIEDSDVSSGIGNTVLNLYLRDQDPATSAIFIDFRDGGGRVGSVTHNDDGGGVTYNTTSDYRLKENINYDWDALTLLNQLKPAKFNFIGKTDKTRQGFLAHEVSNIVPGSVKGEKDHIESIGTITDSDGNTVHEGVYEHFCKTDEGQTWTQTGTEPLYQQLDYSRLVPLLTKAIQEQQTIIDDLKTRIETLEG